MPFEIKHETDGLGRITAVQLHEVDATVLTIEAYVDPYGVMLRMPQTTPIPLADLYAFFDAVRSAFGAADADTDADPEPDPVEDWEKRIEEIRKLPRFPEYPIHPMPKLPTRPNPQAPWRWGDLQVWSVVDLGGIPSDAR